MPLPIKLFALCLLLTPATLLSAQQADLARAIESAGDNGTEIQRALDSVPADQTKAMQFLVRHMPERDLHSLKADFLLRNVDLAYRTWKSSPWQVPEAIFLNNILPYANINEKRDDFREQFHRRFAPLVKDAKSPGEAAAILNNKVFPELQVKYSRKRNRADQGPFESIESGLASCTGLSILLIDACRSVGVPARFVGTPLWSDRSGNHSWVEVWDHGWHFTGAAEPTGMELDKGWFIARASKAQRDDPRHAIYAVSFKQTPTQFPLVWDRSIDYVYAVNVTDRYANKAEALPPNYLQAMFKTYGISGDRCCVPFKVKDGNGKVVFAGTTKDESFDGNDHTSVPLPIGASFQVEFATGKQETITTAASESKSQLFAFAVDGTSSPSGSTHATALEELKTYLQSDNMDWNDVCQQPFASVALSKRDAARAKELLIEARRRQLRHERKDEHENRELVHGEHKMPFFFKKFGDQPSGGRSLFISMHGGGGAPKRVNDRQWENQKRLYEPTEGVYVAPRAPTDTWNLWHEPHVMPMFDRLIENVILLEDVNPNRVYLMGYSAGGDGVYQLAPRMADRLAAAAMMAGHPNDAQPQSLSNIGFAIYMGGKDGAYKRNQVAAEWGEKLKSLQAENPGSYQHLLTIYPNKGHWMEGEDASSLPWMMKFTRDPLPKKVVWRKDSNPQPRFYWLGANMEGWRVGEQLAVSIEDQTIAFAKQDEPTKTTVYLNDELVDLDKTVKVHWPSGVESATQVSRTISVLHESLSHRFDPAVVYSAKLTE